MERRCTTTFASFAGGERGAGDAQAMESHDRHGRNLLEGWVVRALNRSTVLDLAGEALLFELAADVLAWALHSLSGDVWQS